MVTVIIHLLERIKATRNMKLTNQKLFKVVMIWTIITSVFAWLPLIRIIGRPEEYYWSVGGLRGEGYSGQFWIFIPVVLLVLSMMYSAYRASRKVFYPLLVMWHLLFTGVVAHGIVQSGMDGTIEGQGLHWELPLWLFIIPCVVFLIAATSWVILDYKAGGVVSVSKWTLNNTKKLVGSIVLLIVALTLFRLGTNYNWVTALAIIFTILFWILLTASFQSVNKSES